MRQLHDLLPPSLTPLLSACSLLGWAKPVQGRGLQGWANSNSSGFKPLLENCRNVLTYPLQMQLEQQRNLVHTLGSENNAELRCSWFNSQTLCTVEFSCCIVPLLRAGRKQSIGLFYTAVVKHLGPDMSMHK